MSIKMIATDIDGTILKEDFEFNPAVKACIKELCERGVKIVLVTGRMHSATTHVAEELGLDTPIISYQGGMVKEQGENGQILYSKTLCPDTACRIINWAKANNVHVNLYMEDKLYVEPDNAAILRYTAERHISYNLCEFESVELDNINKILAIDFEDADRVTGWINFLQKEFPELYIVKSTPYFCEICNIEAHKGYAVEFLRDYWGLKKEEVLAIGDQDNDIELLKAGGIKVAMGNATDALKACADYITDTVENDGFVKAIERFTKDNRF